MRKIPLLFLIPLLPGCVHMVSIPAETFIFQVDYTSGKRLSPFRYSDRVYKTIEKLALNCGLDLQDRTDSDRARRQFRFSGASGVFCYEYESMRLTVSGKPELTGRVRKILSEEKFFFREKQFRSAE